MSARDRLDAATLAERMNARPLPEGTDGGEWYAAWSWPGECCESCRKPLPALSSVVSSAGNAVITLCLPCAVADCEQAEAEHRAADPHCTCNDCMAHEIGGAS